MSVTLINAIGFTTCVGGLVLYGKEMYEKSQIEAVTETYDGSEVEYDLQTEVIGLGIQMVSYFVGMLFESTEVAVITVEDRELGDYDIKV